MITIYLLASVLVGAFLGKWLRESQAISIKFLLSFSGAYLLGISVFHLLPEVYETHSHHYGLLVVAGFLVQLLLEAFSKGLEHGHSHVAMFKNKGLPMGVLISLFLHAFLESIPIGSNHNHLSREALLWGIVVHKVPVSIILYNMLCELKLSLSKRISIIAIFALMAPLGVYFGDWFSFLADYSRELTAFVFGIFLHISTTILFEDNKSHHFNIMKYAVILLGLLIAWLSVSH